MRHGRSSSKSLQVQRYWPLTKSRKYHVKHGSGLSTYKSKAHMRDRYGKYKDGRQIEVDIIAGSYSVKKVE